MLRQLTFFAMAACLSGAALTGGALAGAAPQGGYPSRPIVLTVGTAPGGVMDVVSKGFANALSKEFKQPVSVENWASYSGAEAAELVQVAPPDGYKLLVFSGAQHISLPRMQSTSYDPIKGFAPVTTLFTLVNFLAVPANSPATTAAQLLEQGRTKPGGLKFASSGLGSTSHITAMSLAVTGKVPVTVTHYQGARPMLTDLLAGRSDFTLVSYAVAKPAIDGGQLKLLAVDALERWPDRPNVPTLKEAGIEQEKVASWFAVAAPAGTPAPIVRRLHDAIVKVGTEPALVQVLRQAGVVVNTSTPEELQALMTHETEALDALVQKLNLKQ